MHHTIVALEGIHIPIPHFDIPENHTATQIVHHSTSIAELPSRVKDATIIVNTTRPITAAILDPAVTPNLQLIAQLATGTDNIDLEACKKRGIRVCNTPSSNTATVAEHAVALYFATRRSIPILHARTRKGDWKATSSITPSMRDGDGNPPLTCQEEICGIVGYGSIGKRVAELMKGLGMRVVISGRKNAAVNGIREDGDGDIVDVGNLENPTRSSFESVIRHATVLVVTCPLTPETRNLVSTRELGLMKRSAVLINVARGGIVDEAALADALQNKVIAGAAADVFLLEPSGPEDSPLLRLGEDVRFIATSHTAWFSQLTMTNIQRMIKEDVEAFLAGAPVRVVV
jgi:lactate dehydrogenase-like 2-hydroxyacid dehydrogenase